MSPQTAYKTIFFSPVSDGFGMSSIALGFVRALQREGVKVAYVKPVAEFDVTGSSPDRSVQFVRTLCALPVPEPIAGMRAEQMIRDGELDDLLEEIVGLVEAHRGDSDLVVVEGLGPSIDHPLAADLNLDISRNLRAEVIAVVPGRHGGVRHVVEAVADASHQLDADGGRALAGVLVARAPDATAFAGLPEALAAEGLTVPVVGITVNSPTQAGPRLTDFAADLGFAMLRRGKIDQARVKNIVVAARSVDNLVPVFQPGTLVVTPGDRSDVVLTTALAHATGLPIAGLLLTCGAPIAAPIASFLEPRLGDLPVLGTDLQTYEVAVALSTVDKRVRADDRERMQGLMDHVADHIDVSALVASIARNEVVPMTPPMFRHRLIQAARQAQQRIVLPEGDEPRTLEAAVICTERQIAHCILLGDAARIRSVAAAQGLTLPPQLEILDPLVLRPKYVAGFVDLRQHKGIAAGHAWRHLEDPVVVGTMMVAQGHVDGLVSGAVHTTANTVRPALQLIKTTPGSSIVSSVFFMLMPDQVLVYGDCAINPDPTAEELAEIAIQSADSARAFGIEPRVAMISYSTGVSGEGELVDKVRQATELAKCRRPDLVIDGPIQYDAASVESVGRQKAPNSPLGGHATVFVFPDLNTGNTTYKAVQRSAGVVTVGPLLQGLRKPVNDLSRGASVDDIVYTIAMTAVQAAEAKAALPATAQNPPGAGA